jgi:carbonic anhydrase/acetyltransferase-like protein (isoleucine patch superfamily)
VKASHDKQAYRFMQQQPHFGQRVFVSAQASISGSVVLGDDVSIWPMAVIRGDDNHIEVGPRCNIQDGAILHGTPESSYSPRGGALTLAGDITVGHRVILHACTIGHRCLVGMGAIVMDGVVLEDETMIAAGAVVTPGTIVPARTLWKGNPARLARPLTDHEVQLLHYSAAHYVRLKDLYLAGKGHRRSSATGLKTEL